MSSFLAPVCSRDILGSMESFTDMALVLSLRAHMDKGYIVNVLTRRHGRHAGYAYKTAISGLEIATLAEIRWEGRLADQLGNFKHFDIERNFAPLVIGDRLKLALVQSMCGICDAVLPEREPHPDIFEAASAFLEFLITNDDALISGASYIMWELLVLRALGYGLDLSKCASTETRENLIYVSPKTGKAVCAEAGEPYKDRLLTLPPFLRPEGAGDITMQDVRNGLLLTRTFFEKWVMTHMSANLPNTRYDVENRFKEPS